MRIATATLSLLLAACAAAPAVSQDADDPLTRPIAPEYADRWLKPIAPVRLHGASYFVGFSGLGIVLVDTGDGLILFDGGVPQAVPQIEANIRALGFDIADVKLIFSTEVHWDHAGGFAALARDSGATVVASAWSAPRLRRGMTGPDDPQFAIRIALPPVERVRAVADGEEIRIGNTVVTAVATPGHTPGSMSWRWQSCEAGACRTMVFASSLNAVSSDDYRFTDPANAGVVASFRASIARLRAMPCDILLITHPDQFGLDSRLAALAGHAAPDTLVDPAACRSYADAAERKLEARLAREVDGG